MSFLDWFKRDTSNEVASTPHQKIDQDILTEEERKRVDAYVGGMLGLACGDALGAFNEFGEATIFDPCLDMMGSERYELPPGFWTDDTSMAICLAESLIAHPDGNVKDQMDRYLRWYRYGENSSNGLCFDIGDTVRAALNSYQHSQNPLSGKEDNRQSGNGGIMRLLPVALRFYDTPLLLREKARESSATTHASPICLEAAELFARLLARAVSSDNKHDVLSIINAGDFETEEMQELASLHFLDTPYQQLKPSGYVINSLKFALWCFYHTDNFEEATLMSINKGGDSDTIGAITGQLAGCFYGKKAIPERWLDQLHDVNRLEDVAQQLFEITR